ncbi:MAG: O-antigen ligase family protein, partial [Anaerolineaceae bacterium]
MPVFLLVVIYLVSTAFSVTRLLSWAGSYQRLQGTYTILAYITIFALLVTSIRSREQVTRLVSTIIITSIPISLYGMLQRLGLDPIAWTGAGNVQARITSTLGNSIFLAAYLIMVVPLTLARTISASTDILDDGQTAVGNVIRALLYCLILIIQVIAIFWSGSRGPFLGLVTSIYAFVLILLVTLRNSESGTRRFSVIDGGRAIALVLFGVILPFFVITVVLSPSLIPIVSFALFLAAVAVVVLVIMIRAISHRGWRWLWLSWILLAMVLAVIFGLFNASGELSGAFSRSSVAGTTLKTLSAWRGLPEIGRFGQLLESESGYGRVRVLIWEGVTDLIAPHEPLETPDGKPDSFNTLRPIIGYGPESMSAAYNRYYRPELASLEGHLALPDRSHNETFDAIVITGLTGLFVWQLLYLSVFYFGFRWLGVVRTKRDRNVLIGLWIGGGLLGGVVISSLLGRPFLGVAVPFGTIMGVVIYLIYYALVVKGAVEDDNAAPFSMDRLLMIALVSAILAHYVEIHFGIAITATRTYFFVYLALIFSVGFRLPMLSNSDEQGISKNRRQK